jgi:hypothetical protein
VVSFACDAGRRDGPPWSVAEEEVRAAWPEARLIERRAVDEARWAEVGGAMETVWEVRAG